jgi:hypothetical protein
MTNDEIREAVKHHCLSDEPALLVEPIKWWKHRKIKKAESKAWFEQNGIFRPSFFKGPIVWFKYWFTLQPGRGITNFYVWFSVFKGDIIWTWHKRRMSQSEPNPEVMRVVHLLLDACEMPDEKTDHKPSH